MRKMKAQVHNGGLGLLPRVALVRLLVVVSFGEEMGMKMASPLPFFEFLHQARLPKRANNNFFFAKTFAKLCYSLLYFL